ncbi:hypothetical protein [Winogradskyella sediminis]|uniref:hypothetical protein n=1 Tax=Winogradskyella sediminis TaxID=1382466 RepID=UPI000E36F04F|nr:hypothetical protein [Winogradskyella sediminis]REG81577.1 hypothetical protein C8N41_1291 [Winogradskyella sediminis]
MRKLNLLISLLIILYSCGSNQKTVSEIEDKENNDIGTIDLRKQGLRLKVGPTWYDNESEIHFVYGVSEKTVENYITELPFNFGGNIECQNKSLSAIFDFKNSNELILSDSINKLLPATKEIIQRKQDDFRIEFDFTNPSPGILVFAIEKVNLKPNRKQNNIKLKIKSECNEYLNLPIVLSKYDVPTVEELINNYIQSELNQLSANELKTIKVIFSHNQTHETEHFLIDIVDQRNMQILTYDSLAKEFILSDFEKNIIRKIKHST